MSIKTLRSVDAENRKKVEIIGTMTTWGMRLSQLGYK